MAQLSLRTLCVILHAIKYGVRFVLSVVTYIYIFLSFKMDWQGFTAFLTLINQECKLPFT